MKIEQKVIKTIVIKEIKRLDPVTVMIDQIEDGKGKITVEVFGSSWSAYWGGMGGGKLEDFFLSCDNPYLINCLDRGIASTVTDFDAIPKYLQKIVLDDRRSWNIDADDARRIYDELNHINFENMEQIYHFHIEGLEDWRDDLPIACNHEYAYLDRIVTAIKEAFKMIKNDQKIAL